MNVYGDPAGRRLYVISATIDGRAAIRLKVDPKMLVMRPGS